MTTDRALLCEALLLGRAPSADEMTGVQAAVGAGYPGDAAFTLTGVVNGAAQTFATADSATDLSELPVYVTLNSGVTPTLVDINGGSRTFANATQLAGYLLGQALQSGDATPVLLSEACKITDARCTVIRRNILQDTQ